MPKPQHMLPIYKYVVRDKNGKVMQIHERSTIDSNLISYETIKDYSVTITRI